MMKLYLKYFSMQIKIMLEYRKAFIASCLTQILTSITAFISIIFLFEKFGNVLNYTFDNVLICFSVSFVGYSIAECIFRGFDMFDKMLGNGEFDRILVRPRNILLQVLGSKIEFSKFGRTLTAITVFIGILVKNPDLLTIKKMLTMLLMIIGTIVIYASLFILRAGVSFFTTQSLEIMNIFTDGTRDLAQYPIDIYPKWIKTFFTYILPLAMVNYYPLLFVIERTDNILCMISPVVSILFILPCYAVWCVGLRKYKSIGS